MLKDKINDLISESMKAHDNVRTNTLRLIKAALLKAEKDNSVYTEELETKVLLKMVAEHKDSIHCFEDRKDLQAKEQAELDIIQEFAPKEASEEDIINKTKEVIAYRNSCIGKVTMKDMKAILTEVQLTYPTASGVLVSSVVRESL